MPVRMMQSSARDRGTRGLDRPATAMPREAPPGAFRASVGVRAGFVTFGFGLMLYLFVQLGLVAGPILTRSVPPGTTDAYVYIAKAQQIVSCFRQRCPALSDLRRQVAIPKGATAKTAKLRSLAYQRELYQYHLAHSGLLVGLKSLGLGWEAALNAVSIAGALIIVIGLAWLLYAVFGAGPAGLALTILAFGVYPGYHGLHWMVPSNFAFGIGLLALAGVVSRPRWLEWALPVAVLAMVWMHPAGHIYALAALALYAALVARHERKRWITVAWGLAALASPILAGALVDRPSLTYAGLEGVAGWGFLEGIGKNARAALWAIFPWLYERGGFAILGLASVGVWMAEPARAAPIRLLFALSGCLSAASLVYVLPNYPAELFHRLWILFVVVASGTASYALWSGTGRLFARFVEGAGDGQTSAGRYALLGRLGVAGAIALVSLTIGIGSIVNGSRAALAKARYMTLWGSMPLDRGQPGRVLARLGEGERVAYLDELSFVFYASRGGLDQGAVFGPAVKGTRLAGTYYRDGGRVTLAVHALKDFYGLLPLRSERPIVVRSARAVDWSRARIKIRAPATPLTLRVRLAGPGERMAVISVPAGATGWYALGLPKGSVSAAIAIVRESGRRMASIEGLRLAPTDRRVWPWDRGIKILRWNVGAGLVKALRGPAEPAKSRRKAVFRHRFVSADLVPAGCRNLGVIEDYGATVASLVSCTQPVKKTTVTR